MSDTTKVKSSSTIVIGITSRTMRWVPFFALTILVYLAMHNFIQDLRAPIFEIGTFTLTSIEILFAVAFVFSMLELLKVANPGRNDAGQVLLMTLAAIANIVLFTIGAVMAWSGIDAFFTVFATAEFLVLIIFSIVQASMANWINGVTAQRTIGTGTEFG